MAVPTIVGVGAKAAGTAAITPPFPTSYTPATADNDVAIIFRECDNSDTVTVPSGWAIITQQGVASGTTTKLSAIWKRLVTGDTAPSCADAGNHQVGQMIIVRGCATSGDPWDVTGVTTELTADTSVSIPGVTTNINDCLILAAFCTGQDTTSAAGATGWANSNLANPSITEQMDNWDATGSGNGGGLAMAAGGLATAGATGATTATLSLTANFKALMTIALKPTTPPKTIAATRVSYAESTWTGTGTTKLAGSVSWLTGDRVVVLGMTADDGTTLSTPTVTGLTFVAVGTNPTGGVDNCQGYAWAAMAGSDSSGQVQGNASNTTNDWGIGVWVFRGSDGMGARGSNASTAKTVSLARGDDHSRVVEIIGDWSAAVTTSHAWTPSSETEDEATQDSPFYTIYVADWGDQGSAGTTSYGISGTASTGVHTKVAVEVLGTTGGVGSLMPFHRLNSGLILRGSR